MSGPDKPAHAQPTTVTLQDLPKGRAAHGMTNISRLSLCARFDESWLRASHDVGSDYGPRIILAHGLTIFASVYLMTRDMNEM
jgi:hypothetical protein